MKKKIKEYICNEIIKSPDYPLMDDDALISGGLIDSFSLVHIAVFIEKELGVKIPDTDLNVETMDTINTIVKRIEEELNMGGNQ